jgi:histidinol-phosphate aminotransferase
VEQHAVARLAESFFKPALAGIVPYEPGKPAEEVQRELGLERVVKLASNEGPYGPFPAAEEVLARGIRDLNRYPDGGFYRLRQALAERHGVRPEEVAPAAGADGVVMYLSLAALDPGDEVVCGWPSFPSYVLDALKLGAVCRQVPLRDDRYDLGAMLGAITRRTKIVYVCNPNNPTGTVTPRAEIEALIASKPGGSVVLLDEAYVHFCDEPPGADLVRTEKDVVVLRTFSKIFGMAGLRVGYAIGHPETLAALQRQGSSGTLSSASLAAAAAALADRTHLAAEKERNRATRRFTREKQRYRQRNHALHLLPHLTPDHDPIACRVCGARRLPPGYSALRVEYSKSRALK